MSFQSQSQHSYFATTFFSSSNAIVDTTSLIFEKIVIYTIETTAAEENTPKEMARRLGTSKI
jgi:hypothetical protein